MGKGCVRFKWLGDFALRRTVRRARTLRQRWRGANFTAGRGRAREGGRAPNVGNFGRPRVVASWSREAGAAVLVKTGRPHRCARLRGGAHDQLPGGEGAHGQGKVILLSCRHGKI